MQLRQTFSVLYTVFFAIKHFSFNYGKPFYFEIFLVCGGVGRGGVGRGGTSGVDVSRLPCSAGEGTGGRGNREPGRFFMDWRKSSPQDLRWCCLSGLASDFDILRCGTSGGTSSPSESVEISCTGPRALSRDPHEPELEELEVEALLIVLSR